MEKIFKQKLNDDRSSINRLRTALSERQYKFLISKVWQAKTKKKPESNILLEKYDISNEANGKRLVVPSTNATEKIYYVHDNELFSLFMEAHMSLNHGNCQDMMKKLKEKYKNISYKDIMIFLSLCKECVQNKQTQLDETDKRAAQLNNQCCIDIINCREAPDGEFMYIMAYRELYTKFSILKPLKSKRPQEVADNLINIFGILGPPEFLQSNLGTKFVGQVIAILEILWPSRDIGVMKYEDKEGSPQQAIEDLLTSWMRDNNKTNWSEGLRFVQLKHNAIFNPAINTTPYEALFKYPIKIGSSSEVNDVTEKCKERTHHDVQVSDEKQLTDEDDNDDDEMDELLLGLCKDEPKSMCGNCGHQAEDDEEECSRCEIRKC